MSAATYERCQRADSRDPKSMQTYLTSERQEGLVKPLLLGVADVGRDDLFEGQTMALALELLAELLSLDRELAADGVLDLENRGVKVGRSEGTHVVGVTERGWRRPGQADELVL